VKLYSFGIKEQAHIIPVLFGLSGAGEVINNHPSTLLHDGTLVIGLTDEQALSAADRLSPAIGNVVIVATIGKNGGFVYNGPTPPDAVNGVGSWVNDKGATLIEPVMLFSDQTRNHAVRLRDDYKQECVLYTDSTGTVEFV
jgi:hypothetical protein